ncbi:MAG: GAF domain-containing protein, partial [Desulfobacteraceae bacterium]|nr:GAF domain-containing protein [Desulfobacteraceae bacterium]
MGKRPGIRNADKTIQVLFEISSVLNRTSTLGEMYKSIHKSLGKIFNVDNMYIALYHEDKDSVTFPYYVDEIDKDFVEVFKISKKQSMIAKVINQKKALLATKDDLMRMASKESGELIGIPCQIWIGAPLMIKDRAFGALALQSYTSRDMFKESDLTLLSSVSEQIAMAIERKKEEEARKKSEEINTTLFEIANAVNTTINLEQLCKSIHESLKKVIYIQNFSLSLYDKEIDQLNFLYHCDATNPESIIENVSQSASLTFEVIRTGNSLLLDRQEQKELVNKLGGGMIGTLAKSWLCIPLKANNNVIGAILTQDYTTEDRFNKKDIELLTIVSGQIALSIERKRAEDAENKSKEINRVMFAISNAVNTTDNLYELYKSIHTILSSVLDVANFMIGIYDHKKDSILYPYFTDEQDDDYSEIQNVSTSGILASEIINRAKPFFITRDEIIERTKVMGARGLGVIPEQWFGVPLIIKKQVIGVVVVQSYSDTERYSEKDVGILLSVSEQVAMAIERKQAEENIKQSEELTKALFSISNAVNTTDNLDDLYRSIYNSLNTLIELPNFFIAIVDEEKKVMNFPFYRDEYDLLETIFFTIDNLEEKGTITTDVIKSKKALFLKKEELEKIAEQNKLVGTVSLVWLGIPLIIRDKVIGVMVVQHYTDPEYFTQKDMDLFIAVSDQVALAIDRKRSQEIILEREKQILQLSRQTQEFSLVAASIISMKDEKEIFKHISKAIVKYSGFQRVLISLFKEEPPFRDIIACEGLDKATINKLRTIEMPSSWYDAVFEQGERIGLLTIYIPHTMKYILNQNATVFGKGSPPAIKNCWHPEDNLFVEMRDQTGQLLGIISVDDP